MFSPLKSPSRKMVRERKPTRLAVEALEPRLMLHHDGGGDPLLAYVQLYGDAPEVNGPPIAGGPLGTISANPISQQDFTYSTRADGLPILNSLPSAPVAIYFDLDGDTNWGGVAPYNTDGNPAVFGAAEQQAIVENWWELAMYFSMFNVNVTTIQPTVPMAWVSWGANPSTTGGLSGVDVFPNSSGGGSQSVAGGGFNLRIGDTLSHEVGHNFGAWHTSSYNAMGNRTAEYASAPDPLHVVNMGAGSTGITKWFLGHSSLGDSVDPTRLQDDMAIIAADIDQRDGSGDGYRPDDFGGTLVTATPLTASGSTQAITGVIERLNDTDVFSFTSTGGTYSILVGRDYPSGVDVKVSVYNASGELLASEDGSPRAVPYTMVNDTHLTLDLAAGTYFIFVQSHGNYGDQGQYVVRVDPMAAGWQGEDIGLVKLPGYDNFNAGTFTVAGSGADIQNTADEFHFVYQTLTGDGSITARLDSMVNTNSSAKAGIMIRESLAAGAKNATIAIKPGNTTQMQYRSTTNGATTNVTGPSGTLVKWMRITRTGSNFKTEVSADGTSWTLIRNQTITMGSTVYIGLAATSHNTVALSEATFSSVSLIGNLNSPGYILNPNLLTPSEITVTGSTRNSINLSWESSSFLGDTNNDGVIDGIDLSLVRENYGAAGPLGDANGDGIVNAVDHVILRDKLNTTGLGPVQYAIDRSADGINFQQVALIPASQTTFTNGGLHDAQKFYYRVRATNNDGSSPPSPIVNGVTRAGAVSNLRLLTYTDTQLVLDWTDASGETGYRVEHSTDGVTNWTPLATLGKNLPMYTHSGLGANTRNYYRIVTLDAEGDSAISATVTGFTRLAAPTVVFTNKASNQMTISWNAVDGATTYTVERSSDRNTWSIVSNNQAATTFADNSVTPLEKYYYRVTAKSATNSSQASAVVFAASPAATPLPSPWITGDIGNPAGSGAAGETGGTVTVIGGGADIWGTSDSYRFTYLSMTGNGSITAQVLSVDTTNYYARAGVMIRNTTFGTNTAANSKFVDIMVHQSDASIRSQYRTSTGGFTGETTYQENVQAPYWVRLTRTGNTFVGETSADGVNWVTLDTRNVSMNNTVLIGLALTPRDNSYLNRAVYDNVTVTTSAGTFTLGSGSGAGSFVAAGADAFVGSLAESSPFTFRPSLFGTNPTAAQRAVTDRALLTLLTDFDIRRREEAWPDSRWRPSLRPERNAASTAASARFEPMFASVLDEVFASLSRAN